MITVLDGNWVRESTATTGTGLTIALSAITGRGRFAPAPAGPTAFVIGAVVPYVIEDGDNWEAGEGTIQAGNTLDRTTVLTTLVGGVYDDTTPARIALSGSAEVFAALGAREVMQKTGTSYATYIARDGSPILSADQTTHLNLGTNGSSIGTIAGAQSYHVVLGNNNHITGASDSAILGGRAHNIADSNAVICGGGANDITAVGGAVGGGWSHLISATWSTIAGGYTSQITGTSILSFIGGGHNHRIINGASYSYVAGGEGCVVDGHTHAGAFGGASATRANFDLVLGNVSSTTGSVANNTIRLAAGAGNILIDGAVSSPEADYAEIYEWEDGNVADEDRAGLFVYPNGEDIVLGSDPEDGFILGIVSATPAVIGDAAPNHWQGMYLKDRLRRPIMVEYLKSTWEIEEVDGDEVVGTGVAYEDVLTGVVYSEYPMPTNPTGKVFVGAVPAGAQNTKLETRKVNPAYDATQADDYLERKERKEFDAIGTHGKLFVQTSEPITGKYVDPDPLNPGHAKNGTRFRVLKVVDDTLARVVLVEENSSEDYVAGTRRGYDWYDGNPDTEDRTGAFVSLYQGKIVKGEGRDDKSRGVFEYLASPFSSANTKSTKRMVGVIDNTGKVVTSGEAIVNTAEIITADYVDATVGGRAINGTTYEVLEVIDSSTSKVLVRG